MDRGAVKETVAHFVTECSLLEDLRERFGVTWAPRGCAKGNIAVQLIFN